MSNVYLLATRQIENSAATIRKRMSLLRREKALRGADRPRTNQDPELNRLLANIIETRSRLAREIAEVRVNSETPGEVAAFLATAQTVMADTAEMADLLLWLGAEMPVDDALYPDSASK